MTFNLTPDLMITGDVADLRIAFREAIVLADKLEAARRVENGEMRKRPTLVRILDRRLSSLSEMSAEDFISAFRLSQFEVAGPAASERLSEALRSLMMKDVASHNVLLVRRWLKFIFAQLWRRRLAQLPLSFTFGSSEMKGIFKPHVPEILGFLLDHENRHDALFTARIVLASPWREFRDIDYNAFAYLLRDLIENDDLAAIAGFVAKDRQKAIAPKFYKCLEKLCQFGVDKGCTISVEAAKQLSYWLRNYRAGLADLEPNIFALRADYIRKQVANRSRSEHSLRNAAAQASLIEMDPLFKPDLRERLRVGDITPAQARVIAIIDSIQLEGGDIYAYFRHLRQVGRSKFPEPCPGRMHLFPQSMWGHWEVCFTKYAEHRKKLGFETHNLQVQIRIAFRDYLCCYLPWWEEKYCVEVVYPEDPSKFRRFGQWVETAPGIEARPDPLLVFYARANLARTNDSHNNFVSGVADFFDYCRAHAEQLPLDEWKFDNPVVPSMDRLNAGRSRSKTIKEPIRRDILPWLLRYGYAVEQFYNVLVDRIIQGEVQTRQNGRLEPFLSASRFGFVPAFDFDGRHFHVEQIPQVAQWKNRRVHGTGAERQCVIPAISAFRMCLMSLESGLRFQGIQWLCRKTFRSIATKTDQG